MHHVLLAHGTGVDALRANGVKNLGIVTNLEKSEPASDKRGRPARAATSAMRMFNGWFLGGVYKGQYPEVLTKIARALPARRTTQKDMEIVSRPLDWAGINYYSRGLYAGDPDPRRRCRSSRSKGPLDKTDLGWEIYPKGLTDLLVRVSSDYTKLPLYVTENGMAETTTTTRRVDLLRRPPQGRARRAEAGRRRARLLRLVAARQLRMGRGLLLALRHRACRLRDPEAHAQGQLPRLPGHAAQHAVKEGAKSEGPLTRR